MGDLSEADLFELIDAAYAASLERSAWHTFLGIFSERFRSHFGALMLQDVRSSEVGFIIQRGSDPAYVDSYLQHFKDLNVWQPHMASLPAGSVSTDEPVMSLTKLKRTEFYEDWLRPQDFAHALGGNVANDELGTMQITVMRSEGAGHYTASERVFLSRLVPHLQRAIHVHRTLVSARMEKDAGLQGLEAYRVGVIVASASGRVVFQNSVAEKMLMRGDGLRCSFGKLRPAVASFEATLAAAIRGAAVTGTAPGEVAGGCLLVPKAAAGRLSVIVTPFRSEAGELFGQGEPRAALFITDESFGPAAAEPDLVREYDLTPAEAKVALLLASGHSLSEIAGTRGVALGTVRAQLKQILAKTNTGRQAELVALVLRGRSASHR